jgi:hypothetical protein
MTAPLETIFQAKYEEFAASLLEVYPEMTTEIKAALSLSSDERLAKYKADILPAGGRPAKPATECPGQVLPGVMISEEMWNSEPEGTKKAINQFLNLLTFSFLMKEGGPDGEEGSFGGAAFEAWANSFMDDFRGKFNRAEFDSFTSRFADLFGTGGSRLPPFPEKLRKGKLVQLAEEIVRELKPEELGLDPEIMKQCEADPSKAFEILMSSTMRHPEKLQTAMKRIVKRLQEKFQKGQFNPRELAAEAEEMMKEFSENPTFVSMMESMRNTFSAADPQNGGSQQSARMNIIKERLRRAQAAKEATRGSNPVTSVPVSVKPDVDYGDDTFASIAVKSSKGKGKKGDVKAPQNVNSKVVKDDMD